MFNKKLNLYLLLLLVLSFFLLSTFTTRADVLKLELKNSPPCLLEGEFGTCGDTSQLENYINLIFRFALGIGGFLALGMILIGAFMITISGSVDKAKEGKDYIQSALLGLALLFGSYLILKTLNPNLVFLTPPTAPPVYLEKEETTQQNKITSEYYTTFYPSLCQEKKIPGIEWVTTFNNSYGDPNTEPTKIEYGLSNTPEYVYYAISTDEAKKSHKENEDKLKSKGIEISSSKNCTSICNVGCTSLTRMPSSAIDFIIKLKETCDCNIVVTGGTEVGHVTHGPDKPIFDLRDDNALGNFLISDSGIKFLKDNGVTFINIEPGMNTKYRYNKNNVEEDFCKRMDSNGIKCSTTEDVPHFHIKIGV